MRKNIFQILQEHFDIKKEIERIEELFGSDLFYHSNRTNYSPERLVDKYVFYGWKQRNRCLNTDDLKEVLNIDNISIRKTITIEEAITYLEYVENILYLACEYIKDKGDFKYYWDYSILNENIESLLDHLNLETYYFDDEEMVLIIEKDEKVSAAAEVVPSSLGIKIIKYNHHTLKGNIEEKKNIIISLSNKLEPKRKQLEKINKQLASDLFYMLNNMNLRHNNKDNTGKNYQPLLSKMRTNTLEKWYDETYQLELLAILLIDNEKRTKKIFELKQKMEGNKNEQ